MTRHPYHLVPRTLIALQADPFPECLLAPPGPDPLSHVLARNDDPLRVFIIVLAKRPPG